MLLQCLLDEKLLSGGPIAIKRSLLPGIYKLSMSKISIKKALVWQFLNSLTIFTTLFPFCCVKILNHSATMLANFALLKEKIAAKISKPI